MISDWWGECNSPRPPNICSKWKHPGLSVGWRWHWLLLTVCPGISHRSYLNYPFMADLNYPQVKLKLPKGLYLNYPKVKVLRFKVYWGHIQTTTPHRSSHILCNNFILVLLSSTKLMVFAILAIFSIKFIVNCGTTHRSDPVSSLKQHFYVKLNKTMTLACLDCQLAICTTSRLVFVFVTVQNPLGNFQMSWATWLDLC